MPDKIREWTLHEEIGRGGMGVVYRATHDILKGEWAVKVMLPQFADDEDYRRRFLSESTVLAGLRHPNIISIQTPFQEAGRLYLPMEYLTGQALSDMLNADKGPWQSLRVMDVVRQAAEGLAHVHGREPPILHHDIKPENIQIMADGLVKIFDFGLARPVDDAGATLTGNAIGTPDYMAPELLSGKRPSTRSDVFALGVVTYRLLAGRLPWDLSREMAPLSRIMALLEAHRKGLPDVRQFAPHADPRLADLTMRAIARDSDTRPVDGAEFLALLDGRVASGSREAAVSPARERPAEQPVLEGLDSGPVAWGIGTEADDSDLDVDFDSPMIPKDDDFGHRGGVIRTAGYRGQRRGIGAGVGIILVGLVLCVGALAAWMLAGDSDGRMPLVDRFNAVLAAITGDIGGVTDVADARAPGGDAGAEGDGVAPAVGKGEASAIPPAPGGQPAVDAEVAEDVGQSALSRGENNAKLAGIEWMRVEGGDFVMGQGAPDAAAQPAHAVRVGPFDMSRTEITVAQYHMCVVDGACTPPYWVGCRGYSRSVKGRTGKIRNYEQVELKLVPEEFRQDTNPVVCVDWEQANAFANWVGARLPSEAEWEFAARGHGGMFPWGDANPTCRNTVMGMAGGTGSEGETWGCGRESTWQVCSKKPGNTKSGLCDMAGNAMEWVADSWFENYADAPADGRARVVGGTDRRVCRGGAWYSFQRGVRSVFRVGHEPATRDIGIGFRVARTFH